MSGISERRLIFALQLSESRRRPHDIAGRGHPPRSDGNAEPRNAGSRPHQRAVGGTKSRRNHMRVQSAGRRLLNLRRRRESGNSCMQYTANPEFVLQVFPLESEIIFV